MDWLSFALGLAGIISTLLASGLALYFTHKARTSPFQEHLYIRQIEIVVELSDIIHEIQNAAGLLVEIHDSEIKPKALKYFELQLERLIKAVHSAVLMPAKLYHGMTNYRASTTEFHEKATKGTVSSDDYYKVMGIGVRLGMLAREFIGADNLTKETLRLYGEKDVDKIDSIKEEDMTIFSKTFWLLFDKVRKG